LRTASLEFDIGFLLDVHFFKLSAVRGTIGAGSLRTCVIVL
jgi:hypothetical protein